MKAGVEILSGIVRCGADYEKYGDPYEFAVAFSSTDGVFATCKALVSPGRKYQASHHRAIIKALSALGLRTTWERFE